MRILVRAPNWIGDQVLAYPFYRYLRSVYPDAKITSVCVPWVKDIQYRGFVDDVVTLDRPRGASFLKKLQSVWRSGGRLRGGSQWDLGISLPNSLSAAIVLHRAGVVSRRGYKADFRGLLLNDPVAFDPDPHRHRSQAYFDLLPDEVRPSRDVRSYWRSMGESLNPEELEVEDLGPEFESEREEVFQAELHWPSVETLEPPTERYWVLAPGATAESRRWPLESFVQLSRKIYKSTGWKGVIVGGPAEAPAGEYLSKDPVLGLDDFTARGSVAGLWRLFRGAELTVTNESGLAHIASLCGSPVQIICGAADPRRTQPIGPGKVRVAVNAVDCWPCERNVCYQESDQKLKCLRGIHASTVWEEWQHGSNS